MTAPLKLSNMLGHLEELVMSGLVPTTLASFGELHDYVDANCLGGLCEDEIFDGLIAHFGGPDEHGGIPDGMLNFINMCQDNLDLIIKSGYFKETTK